MSEVPLETLCTPPHGQVPGSGGASVADARGLSLQGYLAHKKTPTSLGSPQDPRHRPTVGS